MSLLNVLAGNGIGYGGDVGQLTNYASTFGPTGAGSNVKIPTSASLTIGASNDFTYEFWFYLTGTSSYRCAGCFTSASTSILRIDSAWSNSVLSVPFTTLAAPSLNKWYHYAVCRASGIASVFINGTQYASGASAYSVNLSAAIIGNYNNNSNQEWLGYISQYRVSNIARYNSTFNPSTTLYSDNNTLFFTLNSASYVDTGPLNLGALTVTNGTTAPTLITPVITKG